MPNPSVERTPLTLFAGYTRLKMTTLRVIFSSVGVPQLVTR